MKRSKRFWIKERHNPQLGTYYVACGQLSKTTVKAQRQSLHGHNVMHGFDNWEDYNTRLIELQNAGEIIQYAVGEIADGRG
jgi:hypothetical protein